MPRAFSIKRVYDEPGHRDGLRVLVDRLWPRGTLLFGAKDEQHNQAVALGVYLQRRTGMSMK